MTALAACRSVLLAAIVWPTQLAAQERAPAPAPQLPRLFELGAAPANATTLRLGPDGALAGAHGAVALADVGGLGNGGAPLVLEVDRAAPAALVGLVVQRLAAAGARDVLFAAELSGSEKRGVFRLELPPPDSPGAPPEADGDVPTFAADPVLALRHDRPGVAPESMVPLLRRMASGCDDGRLSIRVVVPGDASFENVLHVFAALAATGVCAAVVDWQRTAAQDAAGADLPAVARASTVHPGAAALDLGPVPSLLVQPLAGPRRKPAVATTAPVLPGVVSWHLVRGGGTGGKYGGRAGGRAAAADAGTAIAQGIEWLRRTQEADGRWRHGGEPARDVESTSLVLLTLLGDGQTLYDSPALARGVGWLLARQDDGGAFGPPGEDAVRVHAIACYALVEAYGLSRCPLLRGPTEDALRWLAAQRQPDGGFANGAPRAASDAITTCWALCAITAGTYFRVGELPKPADVAAWYDRAGRGGTYGLHVEERDGDDEHVATATAAALFAQFLAGRSPQEHASMRSAAQWLSANATLADPLAGCWTSHALYQSGGRLWSDWLRRLTSLPGQQLDGELAGSFEPADGASRTATTALRVLTLEARYRYTKLVR